MTAAGLTLTLPPVPRPVEARPPAALRGFEVERIRVTQEHTFAAELERHRLFPRVVSMLGALPSPKDLRRQLMAGSLRLGEAMAPEAYRIAHQACGILGIEGTLELYQRSGPENAAMHRVASPILLELQGSLLPRLDAGALLAVIGHELGHYVAHGPSSPHAAMLGIPTGVLDDPSFEAPLTRFSMACELTADRVALLACQDLGALLRLMLVITSGLAVGELTFDTDAYLAQCKDLIEEDLRTGAVVQADSHPEHNLRVYAAWLFSETRIYRELTGRGPGTRELADVDAIIGRCLGAGALPIHDPVQAADVPREVLEAALAGAVLVAQADGEVTDDEILLLERFFAGELDDWQTYLEPGVALARFLDCAVVLAPIAHEVGPILLNLLFAVLVADHTIHGREIAVVIQLGAQLGIGEVFARRLAAMLRYRGIQLDFATLEPPDEPLPARKTDVDDALQTFLAGVLRRGETPITLRRLLRLLGSDQRRDELIERLDRAFTRHRITFQPPLAQAGLDDRIVLAPAATPAPRPSQQLAVPGSRAALIAALRRLREQLVTGDGRSPSVRLRAPRRGRAFDLTMLERVSVGMAERVMAQVRARRPVKVVDAADAGRHGPAGTVAAEVLALAREDAQCTEETGARDLYVGYPFLTGTAGGYLVRAPLVLYPVELTRDGAGARGFRLDPRKDEPPIANQSLIRLVFNKRNFAYSDELSDELEALAGDPDGGPEAVRRRLAEVGLATADGAPTLQPFGEVDEDGLPAGDRLAIEEVAVLGMFPQSSSDLLQDYDGLLQDLARPDADVGGLLAAAGALLPDSLAPSPPGGDATVGPDWAPVIPADPSQRSVIAEARRHGATVIDGPPGTGKSQVIVNLVAEAVRRGERVAVVCEKRAALDVVRQRMAAIGFGKALAVVHDVHEDRKPLYAHIAARLEASGRVPFTAAEAEAARAEHDRVQSALAQRTSALHARPAGLDMSVGELIAYASQQPAPSLPTIAGLDRLAQAELRPFLDAVVALQPLVDVWAPGTPWRGDGSRPTRRSLAGAPPTIIADLTRALEQAVTTARAFEQRVASTPPGVSLDRVDAARAALATAVASRTLRADATDASLFGTITQVAATAPERLGETGHAAQALHDASVALTRLEHPVRFDGSHQLTYTLSVLSRWSGSWQRVFVVGWWKARGRFRAELARLWPERAAEPLTPALLADVRDRIAASRAWSVIGGVFDRLGLATLMPSSARQLAPAVERVAGMSDRVRALAAVREPLAAAGAWLPDGPPTPASLAAWDHAVDERLALLAARDALLAAAAELQAWFPVLPRLPRAATLEKVLAAWRADAPRLAEADALLARATALVPGAVTLLDAAAAGWREQPPATWRSQLAAAWAAAWLARLEREQPLLATLGHGADDREVERLAVRLRELETERRELEIERTLSRLDDAELLTVEAAAKHARRTPAQKQREELLKEARKQRMLMPLRTFVRRFAPAGLLDVVPVWLLSPETMAILFPRQPLFDLVVFDEASQCTVEAGLPVLLRARRVVIAGDEKQMPPSSYFSLGTGDDDSDRAAGVEADERQDTLRDLLTAESLLSLARPRVAHTGLAWHYRCQDEALIAFSNHAMYEGGLLSIPSTAGAAAPSALRWVSVQDGVYNAGENVPEAARVVDVLDELLARSPRPTVGVVTFNLKQRKAVQDAIDARRATDERFAARWNDAAALPMDERPFVRNLEQVQGDERDIIIFSLGHAPQARRRGGVATGETYVPARFGPLGQRGGERRLNVAVSRAKQACYVVASFEPSQLVVAAAKHQGPRLFKHFLEFAHFHHQGRKLEAARVLELVRGATRAAGTARHRLPLDGFVPLATQLALALEAAGIPHEADIGASGFQIPLAILDPADPTRYALAILLQDGTQPAGAFDQHVHRPGVLRQRGWKVLTISAASWHRRGQELLAEIEALVPGCRGAATSDVYQRHREALARVAGPTGVTTPTRKPGASPKPPGPLGRGTGPAHAATDAAPDPVDDRPSGRRDSAPAPALPAWATVTDDDLFRAALLHLERHGLLAESELTSMVGGPRRARIFARELDTWRPGLPFGVEVSVVEGAKAYKKVGTA